MHFMGGEISVEWGRGAGEAWTKAKGHRVGEPSNRGRCFIFVFRRKGADEMGPEKVRCTVINIHTNFGYGFRFLGSL